MIKISLKRGPEVVRFAPGKPGNIMELYIHDLFDTIEL